MDRKYQLLQKDLGYHFSKKKNLNRALTHPTFSDVEGKKKGRKHDVPHQQVFSTLGDAVLKTGLILILMKNLKTKGDITKLKAKIENNLELVEVGKRLKLLENQLIFHSITNEKKLNEESGKILADTVEALIGAVFLDSSNSMPKTMKCIRHIFKEEIMELEKST